MEAEIDDFYFTSKFDSGNLAKVQSIKFWGPTNPNSPDNSSELYPNLRPEYRFHLWTKPDAAGTVYENSNRTWFHFAVQTRRRSCVVQYVMQNLNKQMRLYAQGMAPVFCNKPGIDEYERIPHQPWFWLDGEQFFMSFIHVTPASSSVFTYFAFTYPYSYEKLQRYLGTLDARFSHCRYLSEKSAKDQIYYSRELVCNSLEGRNIDLLTITSCHGMTKLREPHLTCLFPNKTMRPHFFEGKRIVFLSARVHPGETPSSYVLHGFLDFILSDSEFLAYKLRKRYVFKIIPMLNPDGVSMGHYRTDSRGVNLNRVYIDPVLEQHPSVFAVKTLILYYHVANRKKNNRPSTAVKTNRRWLKKNKTDLKESKTPLIKLEVIGKSVTQQDESVPGPSTQPDPPTTIARERMSLPLILNPLTTTIASLKAFKTSLEQKTEVVTEDDKFGINFQPEVVRVAMPDDCINPELSAGPSWLEPVSPKEIEEKVVEELPPVPNTGMLETFNEEWSSFVTSVLKIRGELSQTLKELQETFSLTLTENTPRSVAGADVEPKREDDFLDIPSESAGSEREEEVKTPEQIYGTHLLVPQFSEEISSAESGIVLYVDMHGHASRRGCFMYGNHFDDMEEKVDSMVLPKLLSINCPYFDFTSCIFTRKNMFSPDRKDGTSKLGCGRVAIHTMTKITRSYTLECNYNTGVMSSTYAAKNSACIMQSSIPPQSTYKPQVYEQVGRSLAVTILDTEDTPRSGSRLGISECRSMPGVRDWLRSYIRQSEIKLGVRSSSPKAKPARQSTSTAAIAVPRRRQQTHRRKPFTSRSASRRHSTVNKGNLIDGNTCSSMAEFVKNLGKKASPGGDDKRAPVKLKKVTGKRRITQCRPSGSSGEVNTRSKLRVKKSTLQTEGKVASGASGGNKIKAKTPTKITRKKSPQLFRKRSRSNRLVQESVGQI